jgi:hypothetical protein
MPANLSFGHSPRAIAGAHGAIWSALEAGLLSGVRHAAVSDALS